MWLDFGIHASDALKKGSNTLLNQIEKIFYELKLIVDEILFKNIKGSS